MQKLAKLRPYKERISFQASFKNLDKKVSRLSAKVSELSALMDELRLGKPRPEPMRRATPVLIEGEYRILN
jgi:hypothetical protein